MIFFDIDQTLLDHESAANSAILALATQYLGDAGFDDQHLLKEWQTISKKHYSAYLAGSLSFGLQRRLRIKELFEKYELSLTDERADELFETLVKIYEDNLAIFSDTLRCLDLLIMNGWRLGIISNGSREQQLKKLQVLRILEFFNIVVASEEVGASKPDPRIFKEACKQANETIQDSIFVGDSLEIDVMGSRNAGMVGVWLNRKMDINNPAFNLIQIPTINSLDALPGLITILKIHGLHERDE